MTANPPQLVRKMQSIKYGTQADYSVPVTAKDVHVYCKSGAHNHGSSKVKLTNRIDYNWELRYYHGQLVAVHIAGKILAYAMKGKTCGMVRLVNQETDQRALIKNLKIDVRDVSFAFIRTEVILGCVDEEANILLYQIEDNSSTLDYTLLLHIYHPNSVTTNSSNYRLVWCPYFPSIDTDEDPDPADDTAKMFVFINGSTAEVWDLCALQSKNCEEPIQPDDNLDGYVEIAHTMHLVDVSFSSDGTAIATAAVDGSVKFFQIYMVDNEKQKLLHDWVPHDGKPLSCLIFIDNILDYNVDSRFWKFALTGANHNSELKLWSCETWTCLQTIHFKPEPNSLIPSVYLKLSIDYSGQYVIMSDINNKVLYILQIQKSDAEKLVAVTNISQFLLPASFLSFYITKAEVLETQLGHNHDDIYSLDDFDDDINYNAVNIDMFIIQPKKFQECKIVYVPESASEEPNDVAITSESLVDMNGTNEIIPELNNLQNSVSLLIQSNKPQMNLMTPDDFTASNQNSRANSLRNSIEAVGAEKVINVPTDNLIDLQKPLKSNYASGGSSPSREVQEILSLNNSNYSNQELLDKLSAFEDEEIPTKHFNQKDEGIYTDNCDMLWPKISVVPESTLKEDPLTTTDVASLEIDPTREWTKSQLHNINYRLTSLENCIREQTILIERLHHDLKSGVMKDNSSEIWEEVSKELNITLSKNQLQVAKLIENVLNAHKSNERDTHERLISSTSQTLHKVATENIQAIVLNEMKMTLVPAMLQMMESLKKQLDNQYAQKLASIEASLKESIAKLITNPSVTENLSKAVASIITPSLEKTYKDMIISLLIPSLEKVCQNMFQQINETFTKGTKEYTASVENYMDKQRKTQDKNKDLVAQMNSVAENMRMTSEQLSNIVASEVHKQFNAAFKNIQEKIVCSVRDVVSDEIRMGFKSNASVIETSVINAVRSRSVTPAPYVVDSQVKFSKIQYCVSNGSYDEALQIALSAENLQYVVYVCDKVDVNTLFGGSFNLPQSCILALIQQLSMDLGQNTDVKLTYIHAGISCLNRNDPDTRRFSSNVLKDLAVQLTAFLESNPPVKQRSNAKILLWALESMTSNLKY